MYVDSLIDRALSVCGGSPAELGRRIGVSRVTAHKLAHRTMKLSPELAALMAAIVGDDPHFAMRECSIEMAAPGMAARLRAAFHAATQAAGVAATLLFSDALTGATVISHVTRQLTCCT